MNNKCFIFSGSALKVMAIVSMLIDHAALILLSGTEWAREPIIGTITLYYILRRIGRLAFPLFCFLLVEGYVHTKSKWKYGLSLAAFALISEVPFDLMVNKVYFDLDKQNIYFTLLLGFLLLCTIEKIQNVPIKILCLAGIYFVSSTGNIDYGVSGVLLIGLLYVLREKRVLKALFSFPLLSGGYYALCAFIPIGMYNGERGFIRGKALKYAFYIFYPAHIMILLWIKFNLL